MAFAIAIFTLTSCESVPMPYDLPGFEGGSEEAVDPQGDGSLENPYNVAGVIAYLSTLDSDVESENVVYVKGIVYQNNTDMTTIESYGNMTFTMVDEGNTKNTFTAFQVYGPDKKKFTSVDQIQPGMEVVVCGKVVNYKGNTPETVGKGSAYVFSINGEGGGGPTTTVDPAGTGTAADPYNVTAAVAYINTLAADTESEKEIYIKGKVHANNTTDATISQYGNMTFTMVDEGATDPIFTAFQVYGLDKKKFTSVDQIKEGMEVVVCGKVVNYKGNTPETVGKGSAYVYSIDGQGGTGGTDTPTGDAKGDGTEANPFNVAGIIAYTSALAADVNSDKQVYFTGIVDSFKSGEEPGNSYGNATFYIKDSSTTDKFYCFRVMGPNNEKFTSADQLKVGQTVVVCGNVVNYKGNTPETVSGKAYVVSVEGEGSSTGGGDNPSTGGAGLEDFTNGNFEAWDGSTPVNWKSACSASSASLAQSTDAHGGSYAVTVKGVASANKRLAYKELTLEAGTYTFSLYAKATTENAAQIRLGYVPVTDGAVGSYVYNGYETINTSWGQYSYTFTLEAKTTICLVVMNPKKSNYSTGEDVLIDDATFEKN